MSVFFRDVEKAYAGEQLEKEDFTGSVGMFVHTLPAVCDLIEEEDGRDLIARMGKQLTESMSNDIYSFSEISRELEVSPDVIFVYQADLGEVKTIGGLPAQATPLQPDAAKEQMIFSVLNTEDGYRLEREYNAMNYEEWHMRSIMESMAVVAQDHPRGQGGRRCRYRQRSRVPGLKRVLLRERHRAIEKGADDLATLVGVK